MEMVCLGVFGLVVGQQKEFFKVKEKMLLLGKKQSFVYKFEVVEKSFVFCGKWEILNDVIIKGIVKEGFEVGLVVIFIIVQVECENSQEFSFIFLECIFIVGFKQYSQFESFDQIFNNVVYVIEGKMVCVCWKGKCCSKVWKKWKKKSLKFLVYVGVVLVKFFFRIFEQESCIILVQEDEFLFGVLYVRNILQFIKFLKELGFG